MIEKKNHKKFTHTYNNIKTKWPDGRRTIWKRNLHDKVRAHYNNLMRTHFSDDKH